MKVQTWGFTSNLCSLEVGKLQIFEWFSIHRIMLSQHMNLNCEQNPSSAELIHNGNAIWGILHYWDRHGPWTQKLRSRGANFPAVSLNDLGSLHASSHQAVSYAFESFGAFLLDFCFCSVTTCPPFLPRGYCSHCSPHLRSWTSSSLPSDPSNSCWLPKFGDI